MMVSRNYYSKVDNEDDADILGCPRNNKLL
jgi:hypothetical protein